MAEQLIQTESITLWKFDGEYRTPLGVYRVENGCLKETKFPVAIDTSGNAWRDNGTLGFRRWPPLDLQERIRDAEGAHGS